MKASETEESGIHSRCELHSGCPKHHHNDQMAVVWGTISDGEQLEW